MSKLRHISLRSLLIVFAMAGVYLALAKNYGFGRGLICLFTFVQAASSLLFFWAATSAWREENHRNALAAAVIGTLVLSGAFVIAWMVFQPTETPTPPFSSFGE